MLSSCESGKRQPTLGTPELHLCQHDSRLQQDDEAVSSGECSTLEANLQGAQSSGAELMQQCEHLAAQAASLNEQLTDLQQAHEALRQAICLHLWLLPDLTAPQHDQFDVYLSWTITLALEETATQSQSEFIDHYEFLTAKVIKACPFRKISPV